MNLTIHSTCSMVIDGLMGRLRAMRYSRLLGVLHCPGRFRHSYSTKPVHSTPADEEE